MICTVLFLSLHLTSFSSYVILRPNVKRESSTYANSKLIDSSDKKERRCYVVVKDKGENVSVAKIRGYNGNSKNKDRLYYLSMEKYPLLTKESGVDKKVYSRKAKSTTKLSLSDRSVFDKYPEFRLKSHDTHNVLVHTGIQGKKRRGRKSSS